MREWIDIQQQLTPDFIGILKKRYTILHHIHLAGVIGRRSLASSLNMTERVLRAEVDFLKSQELVIIQPIGIQISDSGKQLLTRMEPYIKDLFGLTELEERIKEHFQLKQVVIVPGDADQSPFTKKELGRAGANTLRKWISKGDVIAVAGGSTMADVADRLTTSPQMKDNWFVPARGGLGEHVELQANSIASTMAKRTGGQYRLLHVPDHLSDEAYQSLVSETNIQEIVEIIRKARIVMHGIGDAMVMAKRRNVDEPTLHKLQREGAVAEAFGYYFDRQGQVVHRIPTVGLRLEDIDPHQVVIGVAGGTSKGMAIAAFLRYGHEDVLVTDEAAATEILKHI